jgi:hypothetical protein
MFGFQGGIPKTGFFDRGPVIGMMDRKTRKGLSKFGAHTRTRWRTSIRRRKKVSEPGQPPSAHAGQIKLIFFAFDSASRSVVIGPLLFGPGHAALIEHGGDITAKRRGKVQVLHYRARPAGRLAFDAELPKAAGYFKD